VSLDPAIAQLDDELGAVATRVGAVLGTDLHLALTARAHERAGWLVAQLRDGGQPDATAADLMALLWPDGDPDPSWWRTPLGLLIAPAAGMLPEDGWSRAEAAAVLGVSVGTVAQLVARRSIEQTTDGSCSRRSVLARLVRLAQRGAGT
jgi:hypothetical protein